MQQQDTPGSCCRASKAEVRRCHHRLIIPFIHTHLLCNQIAFHRLQSIPGMTAFKPTADRYSLGPEPPSMRCRDPCLPCRNVGLLCNQLACGQAHTRGVSHLLMAIGQKTLAGCSCKCTQCCATRGTGRDQLCMRLAMTRRWLMAAGSQGGANIMMRLHAAHASTIAVPVTKHSN